MKHLAILLCTTLLAAMSLAAADTPVYELRVYTANEGKLPDLLKRFQDHTLKLFEKHGITNLGYFVPLDKENGADTRLYVLLSHKSREAGEASRKAFMEDPAWIALQKESEASGKILAKPPEITYLKTTAYSPEVKVGAGAGPRVFELRTYTTAEGKLDSLHARFKDHTMALFKKHGMTNLPYFTPLDADKGAANTLIYFLAHDSKEAGLKSFGAFRTDADWVKAKGESEKDGSLTVKDGVKSVYLKATDFSPIK